MRYSKENGQVKRKTHCLHGLQSEDGQIIPWVIFMMFFFMGMCALTVDVGHAMLVQRQLQASADAAALAASQHLADGQYQTYGQKYSAAVSSNNSYTGVDVGTPTIEPYCSSTVVSFGIPCTGSGNAVRVTETATVAMAFTPFIGIPAITVGAKANASKGTAPIPLNIALIIDTTYSMKSNDPNCSNTSINCAMSGAQQLLLALDPSVDFVSVFTFPAVTTDTVANESNCSNSLIKIGPYTFPAADATSQTMEYDYTTTSKSGTKTTTPYYLTYQVTDFLSDYISGYQASSLNGSSKVTAAMGGKSGCSGIQVASQTSQYLPNTVSSNGYNTYFAGAIYAAQAALVAKRTTRLNANSKDKSKNVIILLSDGNATASNTSTWHDMVVGTEGNPAASTSTSSSTGGKYPSVYGQCGQAVDAAQSFSQKTDPNRTLVFTIAYGAATSSKGGGSSGNGGNCGSDVTPNPSSHPNITPCQTMQQMSTDWATDGSYFYSDYYAPGGTSGCSAKGNLLTITSLNNIFKDLINRLRPSRLIPNE